MSTPDCLPKPNQQLYPNQPKIVPKLFAQIVKYPGEEQLHEHTLFGPDGLYGSKEMAVRLANTSYSAQPGFCDQDLYEKIRLSPADMNDDHHQW